MKTDLKKSDGIDPRESMRVLPKWMQPLLTDLTGKALPEEEAPFRWSWWMRLAVAWLVLLGSVTAGGALLTAEPIYWLLLPMTWLFTVSSLRAFQTTFVHHASHGNLSGRAWLDKVLGEIMSTVTWIVTLREYTEGHLKGHHPRTGLLDGAGPDDPDLWFIVNDMGFKPGGSRRDYWRQLICLLISPGFHGRFFLARTRANLARATAGRRLTAAAYVAVLFGLVALTGAWLQLLWVLLIPGIWLYQVSGVLQVLTEHSWVRDTSGKISKKEVSARLTIGRFVGSRVPDPSQPRSQRILGWIRWTLGMIFWHLPVRLFILPGDLPQHDLHHRKQRADWANPAYARRDDAMQPSAGWPAYQEVWGLVAALNQTFDQLGSISESSELGKPLTYQQRDELMLGM